MRIVLRERGTHMIRTATWFIAAAASITGAANAQSTVRPAGNLDAEFYIDPAQPPPPVTLPPASSTSTSSNYGSTYVNANQTPDSAYAIPKARYYERVIAVWKDPLTLPHSRSECVKWASGHIPFDGNWKTCIGWKVQWQWMYDRAIFSVTTGKPVNIDNAVKICLTTAAVAAAAAAIITGGSAAAAAFEAARESWLIQKLNTSGE